MDEPPDETEDAETEPALYECALTELLAEGIDTDVRPLLKKFQDAPATVAEAFARLPPSMQEELGGGWLPAGDAARAVGLRNAQLSEALREVAESLDEVPTPQWVVGPRRRQPLRGSLQGGCGRPVPAEGLVPGRDRRRVGGGAFCVRYDDGDQEDAVAREFVRPPLPAVAAPAASRGSQRSAGDPHREVDCRHSVCFCDVRWPAGQLGASATGLQAN